MVCTYKRSPWLYELLLTCRQGFEDRPLRQPRGGPPDRPRGGLRDDARGETLDRPTNSERRVHFPPSPELTSYRSPPREPTLPGQDSFRHVPSGSQPADPGVRRPVIYTPPTPVAHPVPPNFPTGPPPPSREQNESPIRVYNPNGYPVESEIPTLTRPNPANADTRFGDTAGANIPPPPLPPPPPPPYAPSQQQHHQNLPPGFDDIPGGETLPTRRGDGGNGGGGVGGGGGQLPFRGRPLS